MSEILKPDICVIGAGSGGLVVAAGAAQMGASVVLLERGRMGGDCLNYGCVPSKALIAAGRAAADIRRAAPFGVSAVPVIDFDRVIDHVHETIAGIAPNDSVARFRALGVDVIEEAGRFTGPREVEVGERRIRARRFVIATGSRPVAPLVAGLEDVLYLTNETLFDNRDRPEHLIIIGGGPIGMEMAQAHRDLGCRVTVIEMFNVLGADDPELARIVADCSRRAGVEIFEHTRVMAAEKSAGGVALSVENDDGEKRIEGSHLLIAAGRAPSIDGLGLEAAGIKHTSGGIKVDNRLRTSDSRVYAIGDVTGGMQFTHVAGYEAGIVLRNALFRLPAKADYDAVPWVTYATPELAQVGLTEERARADHDGIRVLRWPLSENDRARAERHEDGLIKVVTSKRGRILGAGIVAHQAGDLIQPWVLAVAKNMKIGDMAGFVAPYPTLGEISKRAAGSFYTRKLFSARTRALVRFLAKFG